MKRKKIISSAISFVLLFSMASTFTSCSDKKNNSDVLINTDEVIEPLPDKFVDYTDPNNGVSYTYNNAYLLSFDNETDVQEIKDFNTDFYNQVFKNRRPYTNIYADSQYYLTRTKKNEINSSSGSFIYTVDRLSDSDINIYEVSDEDYQIYSDNYKNELASSYKEVSEATSDKYVTYGENQYLHFKYTYDIFGMTNVYEEFSFQLDDGTICQFILYCSEGQYDFTFEYVKEVLESMKKSS